MLTDFRNSFTGRLTGKFATNSYLNSPPHLTYVATVCFLTRGVVFGMPLITYVVNADSGRYADALIV